MRNLAILLALFVAMAGLARGDVYEQELWNDPSAGDHGENLWAYWDEDYSVSGIPETENYHHHPMNWAAGGGVDNSGNVWTPLTDLWHEHDQRAYWPAYLTDQITAEYGVPDREIFLTPNVDYVQMAVKERALAATPVDLHGGKLFFFIGKWWTHPSDPDQDQWVFFYNKNGFYDFNDDEWTTTLVPVGDGTTDWGIISMSGAGNTYPSPPVSEAVELFDSPQQWGFTIFDPAATVLAPPTGELAFDNFAITIPEPSCLVLLAMGIMGLAVRRL